MRVECNKPYRRTLLYTICLLYTSTTFIDFPVFNVADIGITVGVVLALVGYMFLSPAAREVDATAELNARDEARAKRKACLLYTSRCV